MTPRTKPATTRAATIPSPRPLVVFHRFRLGVPCEGYLLVEECPHAIPLADAVRSLATLDPDEQFRILTIWVNSLGRMLRLMHDRGMAHGDCKAANVLVSCIDSDPMAWLPTFIDLVGASSALQIGWSKRHRDLARLAMSFLPSPQVTNSHRLRFLRTYFATVPRLNRNWKPHWIAIERLIRAKVKRNVRRNRPLG